VYFLQQGYGIMEAWAKWEEFYWDRKKSGEDKGSPKDKIPDHGDDELDAVSYLTCSHFRWTPRRPSARIVGDSEPERELIRAAQQFNQMKPNAEDLQAFATIAKPKRVVRGVNEVKVFGDIQHVQQ